MTSSGPLQLKCDVNEVMKIDVKDSTQEVLNVKLYSETPKELVAVGQIKLVGLQFLTGKVENVPLVNKAGG